MLLADAFRALDDESGAATARTIVALQSYIYGPMPSRLTFGHCMDAQVWKQIETNKSSTPVSE